MTNIQVLEVAFRLGVLHVTIFAFLIENFSRPKAEVDLLFRLLRDRIGDLAKNETSIAQHNKLQIRIIGNRQRIPADILADLERIEHQTRSNTTGRVLNVCFPYTSRDEIAHLMRVVIREAIQPWGAGPSSVCLQKLHDNFYFGPKVPPLDLLIRTSGHSRLSDFMLWQCNHSCTVEFTRTLWPDFKAWAFMFVVFKWSYYQTVLKSAVMHPPPPDPAKIKRQLALPAYGLLPAAPHTFSVAGA